MLLHRLLHRTSEHSYVRQQTQRPCAENSSCGKKGAELKACLQRSSRSGEGPTQRMMVGGRSEGGSGGDGRARTKRGITLVLCASLLGGAGLALFAGRGERLEHSAIPLSDAPPPTTTAFESSRPRPRQGDTQTRNHSWTYTWGVVSLPTTPKRRQACLRARVPWKFAEI